VLLYPIIAGFARAKDAKTEDLSKLLSVLILIVSRPPSAFPRII
jgi:hypothetical protein